MKKQIYKKLYFKLGSLAFCGLMFWDKLAGAPAAESSETKPSLRSKLFGTPLVLIPGTILGCLGRYLCTFLSGAIFFGEYAAEGFSAVTWSLYYNGLYIGIELVLTIALLCVPAVRELFARLRREYRRGLN